jgi:hypothetical protein
VEGDRAGAAACAGGAGESALRFGGLPFLHGSAVLPSSCLGGLALEPSTRAMYFKDAGAGVDITCTCCDGTVGEANCEATAVLAVVAPSMVVTSHTGVHACC